MMSKIDDLIAKYCPNGVEYKPVGIVLRQCMRPMLVNQAVNSSPHKKYPNYWQKSPWLTVINQII